jgi:hypothetical protein
MKENVIPEDRIEKAIYLIRGYKVMLDKDLAELYGVKTKELNKAVKRNADRFPADFMFQLTKQEEQNLRFQIGTSSWGGRRYLPVVFTELGVAMLSSILNSQKAIQVNIQIMRTFTRLRQLLSTHKDLLKKIDQMESKYDRQFKVVFDAIRKLVEPPAKPKKRIGFITN